MTHKLVGKWNIQVIDMMKLNGMDNIPIMPSPIMGKLKEGDNGDSEGEERINMKSRSYVL